MFNHEERIAVLERIVKDLDRMYFVLLFALLSACTTVMLLPDTTEPE